MEKYLEYLISSQKKLQTADHLIYMTYPLIKDKKLLLKIMSELNSAVVDLINSVLQYEYLFKHIELTKNPTTNLNLFFQKCALKYRIDNTEIIVIKELLDLNEKHHKSPIEFIRNGNVVILTENLNPSIISPEKIKQFLYSLKTTLRKVQKAISKI